MKASVGKCRVYIEHPADSLMKQLSSTTAQKAQRDNSVSAYKIQLGK